MRKLLRHHKLIVCLLITAGTLALTFTTFRGAFGAIARSGIELMSSLVAYIRFLIFLELPEQSPITPPSDEPINVLPSDPSELGNNFADFFRLLFNGENFTNYLFSLETLLILFVRILPFALMFGILLRKYIKRAFTKHNNRYNKDTKPLRIFKRVSSATYTPTKRYLAGLFDYIRSSRFPKIWLLFWLFNFNVFAVLLSVISISLFFFISFDFVALYHFFYNAIVLLLPAFLFIPIWLWVVLALWLVDRWRKRVALERLRHMESMNKGFLLERSICTMLVGTMGCGKTTLVTDMTLSLESAFRYKAYEMLLEVDLCFPNFAWINFENDLKKQMENGNVFNLATCGEWIAKQRMVFENEQTQENCWGYDFEKYGLEYNDKKTITHLFDALTDYAKLYFIYACTTTSLILSNYSIRTDAQLIDYGNLPLWNDDFFGRDPRLMKAQSRHSHILDFDMFRLGRKVIENNEKANCFEFGVVAITEVGKERGNQYKVQDIKDTVKLLRDTIKDLDRAKADSATHKAELERLTGSATQLTDKFNDSLKLIRHKCTIRGFPFARLLMDEQRPESLGADARDLCEIIHIREKSDVKLAMPFFFLGELIYAYVFGKFVGVYRKYRFNRGDNTLLMHTIKKVGGGVHRSYTGIYNRFGYHIRHLAVEDASTKRILKECPYYVSTKKIYSNRFATDAYGDIFAEDTKTCKVGLNDIREYRDTKATKEELQSQNSYFIEEITKETDKAK